MSEAQLLALVLVPVFTAALSLCGNGLIILDVLYDRQKRRSVYHRIMLVFSCFSMMNSFSMVITTLPVPSDTEVLWALGNEASCDFQAFIMQMGGSACFVYNATLTIYFVQVIRFQRKEALLKKWEVFYHIPAILMGVGTSTAALVMGWLGFADLWCWIGISDPHHYLIRTWAFWYAPCWLCFLIVLVGMSTILRYVYVTEQESARHDAAGKARSFILARANGRKSHGSKSNGIAATTPPVTASTVSVDDGGAHNDDDDEHLDDDDDDDDILDEIDEVDDDDNDDDDDDNDHGENGDVPEEQVEAGQGVAPEAATSAVNRRSSTPQLSSRQKRALMRQKFLDRTKRTRQVATQALYYVLSFYMIYVFCTTDRLYYIITGKPSPFVISLFHVLFEPSQGIFNFIVYRMKFVKGWREKNKNATRCQIFLVYLAISPWKDRACCKPNVPSTSYGTIHLSGELNASKGTKGYVTDMTGAVRSVNVTTSSGVDQ